MIYKGFIFLFLTAIFTLFATSSTELTEYPQFCQSAAENDRVFSNFKRNRIYQQTLEHVSYEHGCQFLDYIVQKYPYLIDYFDKFRKNDEIGNPITYQFGEYGNFSPTTLRYIKVAGDLFEKFGDLSQMNIVEIGAGYGGQCNILAMLGMFASYTIIDLAQCNLLTRKFLDRAGVKNIELIGNKNLSEVKKYDLVISNYAFSEIDNIEQAAYISHVQDHTPNGYMLYNFGVKEAMPIEQLISHLEMSGRLVEATEEQPKTNYYGRSNTMLCWKNIER